MTSTSRSFWPYLVVFCYALLAGVSIAFHEPWRDEAQAWLLARDLPLPSLLAHIHYEGTPALWHLILSPFAAFGAPYWTMHAIHLCIAVACVSLFVFRAPFSIPVKIAFAGSYFMFWEYAVIARNYSLSMLLMFLIASFYATRHRAPMRYAALLFLLFNANVHSIFIASALSGLFFYEAYRRTPSLRGYLFPVLLIAIGALLAFMQLLPSEDTTNQGLFYIFSWRAPFIALANAYFPNIPRAGLITIFLALGVVLLFVLVLYHRSRTVLLLFLYSYAGLFYVFAFKHTGSLRHHGLLLMLLIFVLWISEGQKSKHGMPAVLERIGQYTLLAILAISTFFSIQRHVQEYRAPFSGASQVGQYLNTRLNEEAIIVGHPSIKASAVAPYLPAAQLWYPSTQSFKTYITWNQAYEAGKSLDLSGAIHRAEQIFGDRRMYLILDEPLPPSLSTSYRLVLQTPDVFGYGEEHFYLYTNRADDAPL